jgi:hypothetical protein
MFQSRELADGADHQRLHRGYKARPSADNSHDRAAADLAARAIAAEIDAL